MKKNEKRKLQYEDVKRYGGEYDGYGLAPPTESKLRDEDAKGLREDVYWHVWTAFRDKKLVWC